MRLAENIILSLTMNFRIAGTLRFDKGLFSAFLSSPEDPLPAFKGPTPELRGRSKDHPRYGRWMYAFVKFYKPEIVLEVGTNAGGTAVGIARALVENKKGRLICVDNADAGPRSFPAAAEKNIKSTGLESERFELILGDSKTAVPLLLPRVKRKLGVYLVDGDHTFEGALADIENGLPMMEPGGFILVHDVDLGLDLGDEASPSHPQPVYEALKETAEKRGLEWCILKFIRKHLGVIQAR